MSRRALLPAALTVLLLGAVPALADANGSTEQRTVTRSCSAPADNHYTPPGPDDCKTPDGSPDPDGTYSSTYYSNDVRCGDKNRHASQSGLNVYAGGDPTASGGNAGICQDGSTLPVQGRAGLSGSTTSGSKVTVDGDKDNPNETSQGYLVVEKGAGASAPTYRCGDEHAQGGRADSDAPQERDTAAECGS